MTRLLRAVALLAVLATPGLAAQDGQVTIAGTVRDSGGDPVAGAVVTISASGETATATTDGDGAFALSIAPAEPVTIEVGARGFTPVVAALARGSLGKAVDVTLDPAPFTEEVTVTAARTETRTGESAASVVVLSRDDLDATAAPTLDGALRQVPGFSLFRRTDSRVANPTAQGASLRGLAPSGASRAAVLVDGIPVNDPFGGWVYWSRIPRAAVSRVEVVRGGASSLYGSDALGGVVNFLTDPPARSFAAAELSGGSQGTGLASASAGWGAGPWRADLSGELFHTDGYVLVDEDERGPVDTAAGSRHATIGVRVERSLGGLGRAFVRGGYFAEERDNGTPLQTNQTRIREVAAGVDVGGERYGSLRLRGWGGWQGYDQSFTAVDDDRAGEALTRLQRVPARQGGASAVWSHALAGWLTVVAGADARFVRGTTEEVGYFAGRATSALEAGGRQRGAGAFGEALVRAGERLSIAVGARGDRWSNGDASSFTRSLTTGAVTGERFEDRAESAFSPRLGLVYRVSGAVTARAAVYRAFRAPTLNELYRGFRVGDVVTLANETLRAERLTGAEGGATATLWDGRASVRATLYWSEVTRPVANVTLEVRPDLILRQRQNLGRTRSRGVELDFDLRPAGWLRVTGGYVYADSTVLRFEANPALEGARIPQVPRHQASLQALVEAPWRVAAGVQARLVGSQFDDDRNQFELGAFGALDLVVSRPLSRRLELFGALENLTETRYEVGRTPVTTVGPPFGVRVGVRVR